MKYRKQVGIWLDTREAFIVTLDQERGGTPDVKHLLSEIDTGVAKGGIRGATPYGPQGGVDERAHEERRRHEEKAYYEKIIREIDPKADELMIFGPSESKHGLMNVIETIKHFKPEIKGVFPADSMTQNQLIAKVKDFFATKVEA